MDPHEARLLLGSVRVARLATVRPDGAPHLVPICFALDGDTLVTAIDAKPKRPGTLARLRNIAWEPRVAVLADGWDEDWTRLWWVRRTVRRRSPTATAPDPSSATATSSTSISRRRGP
jgi:PPOX class probable F420-dependent enzyme